MKSAKNYIYVLICMLSGKLNFIKLTGHPVIYVYRAVVVTIMFELIWCAMRYEGSGDLGGFNCFMLYV